MRYDHDKPKKPARLAEPVQVYLQPPDRERLERLTARLSATKSDVLRRGLEALDAQTVVSNPGSRERAALPTFAGSRLLPGVDLDDTVALIDLMEE